MEVDAVNLIRDRIRAYITGIVRQNECFSSKMVKISPIYGSRPTGATSQIDTHHGHITTSMEQIWKHTYVLISKPQSQIHHLRPTFADRGVMIYTTALVHAMVAGGAFL